MSHFSAMRTQMTDKDLLIQALKQQSEISEVKENYYIRGYNNNTTSGHLVGVISNSNYDIGFIRMNNEYVAIADFGMGYCLGGDKNLSALWQRIVQTYLTLDTYKQASQNKTLDQAKISINVR